MRAARRRLRLGAEEGGFTLVEMVVTLLVMSIITAAFLAVFSRALTDSETVQFRRDYLNDMRIAMEQMTKQIRQATAVDTAQADYLGMDTLINGASHHIHYRVDGTTLVREIDGGSATPILQDLASTAVFTYTYSDGILEEIDILLTVDRGNGGTIDLSSQAETRNL